MNSTTIKIDGAKLRQLLETKTGKTIYQIATESGYSKNVISNAIKKGYASSAVQNIARLYEIYPDDYKVIETDPDPVEELKGQISIDDIETIKRDELKVLIKEAVTEVISKYKFVFDYKNNVIYFTDKEISEVIKEDGVCKRQ